MNIFKDILLYKREKLYNKTKTRKTSLKNQGYDYKNISFMAKSTSRHIQRNEIMANFMMFIDDTIKTLLGSARHLRKFKNFTVKKDDNSTR
jgi:hypothetical protein|tara:strand:- start:356 stop:628 length:273 start_codon:yes stop_codon:yes gene_type:complete